MIRLPLALLLKLCLLCWPERLCDDREATLAAANE